MLRRIALLIVLTLSVGAPAAVFADDSAMGSAGGAVQPIPSSTIRMADETVQVVVLDRFAEYTVDFRFENSGATQSVLLGFPFPLPFEEGDYSPPAAFRAWQGGRPLAVTYKVTKSADGARTGYYLHKARFAPGTTMIRVRYLAIPDTSVGLPSDPKTPPGRFEGAPVIHGAYPYIMHSGAGWAGTIGRSVIRYYVSPDALAWGFDTAMAERIKVLNQQATDAAKVLGSYTSPAAGIYEWVFEDVEPTPDGFGQSSYDVALHFFIPAQASASVPPWSPVATTRATSALKLGAFTYPADNATDGNGASAWAEATKGPGRGSR